MNIQISHLSKSFGGQEVLKDISLIINQGEKVSILGGNGSGKSTLLKILVGEVEPDTGFVSINPKNVQVGYLPQVSDDSSRLSSGEKTKRKLSEILSMRPDVLILDEPTNHLDWQSLDWLEKIVKMFTGPVVVVSHDRYFLDNTVKKIIELDSGKIQIYGGNYSFYKQQKQMQIEANERLYFEQQKRIRKLENRARIIKNRTQQLEVSTTGSDHYVRRKAAKAAKTAIAMEKRLNKELVETNIETLKKDWTLKAGFVPKQESSQTLVILKTVGYKNIFSEASLVIEKGQRVALIGNNGSGKTTLVKIIMGQIVPDKGEIKIGNGVKIGYLSQDHLDLRSERIVLDELTDENIDKTEGYKLLRRFLLSPEKIQQKVGLLSSGEKAKLIFAKLMASGANLLILDEPTNHLDIPSREAIEESLAKYMGTLLVVSHDRYFLTNIGIEKYLLVGEGKIVLKNFL